MDLGQFLTTLQQGVQAINAVAQGLLQQFPSTSSGQLTANKLVQAGFVRVTGVSISGTTGTLTGSLNDSATLAGAGSGNAIFALPPNTGFTAVNMIFTNGLVCLPASGQIVTLFYRRS